MASSLQIHTDYEGSESDAPRTSVSKSLQKQDSVVIDIEESDLNEEWNDLEEDGKRDTKSIESSKSALEWEEDIIILESDVDENLLEKCSTIIDTDDVNGGEIVAILNEVEEPRVGANNYEILDEDLDKNEILESANIFDSQDDKFLGGISEDDFYNNPNDVCTPSTSSSIVNKEALKWFEKMKLVEEEQNKICRKLKRFSPGERLFPDLRSSNFHTVTFALTSDYQPGDRLLPYPSKFTSKWEPSYVPIPCCSENVRLVRIRINEEAKGSDEGEQNTIKQERIWTWERVNRQLRDTSLTSCLDIYNAMKYYLRQGGPLNTLQYAIDTLMTSDERENFFSKVLPWISRMCLNLPNILTSPLPLLTRYKNYSISLSQTQIACLLANSFFSTFPKRWTMEESYSSVNFNGLFTGNPNDSRFNCRAEKVRCILHYFERLEKESPCGVVTFTRKAMQATKLPDWSKSTKPLSQMVVLSKGTIEKDGAGTLQVDFANRYIGGGVLGDGAVQEEILFVIYPELLVSRLFTENLASSEALLITGCERFSEYIGYASTFAYAGDFIDCTPCDGKGRKYTQIIAIDALYIRNRVEQFHSRNVLRELNKAYVGFSSPIPLPVAVSTGKWGCGAFNGDPELKAVIQLLAASQAGRDLIFFTFGDTRLQDTMLDIIDTLKDMTVQEVWKLLGQYYSLFCSVGKPSLGLGRFLYQFGKSGIPADIKESIPPVKKLCQVSVAQFYSKPTLSSSPRVVSNFPDPMENPNVKVTVDRDNFTAKTGWLTTDKNKKGKLKNPFASPSATMSTNGTSTNTNTKGEWLDTLDSFKSNWQSKQAKSNETSSGNTKNDKDSYFMTDEEISEAVVVSEEMDYEEMTEKRSTTERNLIKNEKEYKDAFRNSSPVLLKRSKTSVGECLGDSGTSNSLDVSNVNSPSRLQGKGMSLKDFFK